MQYCLSRPSCDIRSMTTKSGDVTCVTDTGSGFVQVAAELRVIALAPTPAARAMTAARTLRTKTLFLRWSFRKTRYLLFRPTAATGSARETADSIGKPATV